MTIPIAQVCNCFAARQAARFITQLYERHLSKAGITGSQYTILAVIQSRPGIAMAELAHELVMDRTSLVRALKPLLSNGYVTAAPGPNAGRKMALSLSSSGLEKFREAGPHWQAAQREWELMVGSERAKALREELIAVTRM
ncbi:MarR family winged helix-turn-helix transcriptional regulator [Pollutimonas bauzanensis]|nr:MarR family winged helix-turn-helix transcriptional regulator [Pollutimonas bauzanensis]